MSPSGFKQPALVVTIVLVLAAVALWTLPEWHIQSAQQAEQTVDDVPQVQSGAAVEPFVVPAADAAVGNATGMSAPVPVVISSDAVAASLPAVASPIVPDLTPKLAGGTVLALSARGSSWIEVTDAKGQVLVRRNLAEGESVLPVGQLPLSVVVGRADMTDVSVRGKPLDVAGLARDNVARFEVK